MFITEMILRLRSQCPFFERKVGGMSEFDKATVEDNNLQTPYAYVVPVEEVAEDATGNAVAQQVTSTFVIVVVLDTSSEKDDGKGMSARTSLDTARRQLLDALLGWEPVAWAFGAPNIVEGNEWLQELVPNSRADTLRYRGWSLVKVTDGRVWYQFEFSTSFYEGRQTVKEYDRYGPLPFTLVDGAAVVVDQTLPTKGTAAITRVLTSGNQIVPTAFYTFTPSTGTLALTTSGKTNLGETPTLKVLYEVQTPAYHDIVRRVYAAYYPDVLEAAGGDPGDITPDMYALVSEVPPGAKVTWLPVNELAPAVEPQHHFGGTPVLEEDE